MMPMRKASPYSFEDFVCLPGGSFTQGCEVGLPREKPSHYVFLDKFCISRTPITVRQYLQFCKLTGHPMPNPPQFNPRWSLKTHPMVCVSWYDATAYCSWLSTYLPYIDLPTEAEWEFIANVGVDWKYLFPYGKEFDTSRLRCSVIEKCFGTVPVRSYSPNILGCYDMAGNVWEWCKDSYSNYTKSTQFNPVSTAPSSNRILRGGSWATEKVDSLRITYRHFSGGNRVSAQIGFRIVYRNRKLGL